MGFVYQDLKNHVIDLYLKGEMDHYLGSHDFDLIKKIGSLSLKDLERMIMFTFYETDAREGYYVEIGIDKEQIVFYFYNNGRTMDVKISLQDIREYQLNKVI